MSQKNNNNGGLPDEIETVQEGDKEPTLEK